MVDSIVDKIRKARQSLVEIGGHKLTITRPTAADIDARPGRDKTTREHLQYWCQFVVGWDLTEIDLLPGGAPDPVPFSRDALIEWIADREDDWSPLISSIRDAYLRFQERKEAESKN